MIKDSIKLTGRLSIKKYDQTGKEVFKTEVPNLVVTSGKEFIAKRIVNNTLDPMGYMAIGDDPSTGSLAQTSLQNELGRVIIDSASPDGVNTTFVATFPAGTGTGDLREAGIFNTSSASVKVFDGDQDVDDGGNTINITSHGWSTGDKVSYNDGGNTAITGLLDGNVYYVIKVDDDYIKLALNATNASAGTAVDITGTSGATHKLSFGDMLCRTTFPVITKSSTESVAISWVITVG